MPVKTGRKLPRARVDAKVAQAAVRLARHVPAAPGTAGSAKVPSTPSQVTLNLTQTPPARPSTEAHTPTSPLNAEVADLLERLAADATPRRRHSGGAPARWTHAIDATPSTPAPRRRRRARPE